MFFPSAYGKLRANRRETARLTVQKSVQRDVLAQHLPDGLCDAQVGRGIGTGGLHINDHQIVAPEVPDEPGGGVHHQTGAADDKGIGMADGIHCAGQHLLVQALFVKHHVRLYDAATAGNSWIAIDLPAAINVSGAGFTLSFANGQLSFQSDN